MPRDRLAPLWKPFLAPFMLGALFVNTLEPPPVLIFDAFTV